MIEETLVTYEQAQKLEKLGFPQSYDKGYRDVYVDDDSDDRVHSGELIWMHTANHMCLNVIEAPTLSLVQKWLIEEKHLVVLVSFEFSGKYSVVIYDSEHPVGTLEAVLEEYSIYEEALSAGIDKALELI